MQQQQQQVDEPVSAALHTERNIDVEAANILCSLALSRSSVCLPLCLSAASLRLCAALTVCCAVWCGVVSVCRVLRVVCGC